MFSAEAAGEEAECTALISQRFGNEQENAFRAEQNNVKHVLTLLVCFILSKLIVSVFCVHSVSPLVQKSPPVNANREVICIFEEYITAPFYWT